MVGDEPQQANKMREAKLARYFCGKLDGVDAQLCADIEGMQKVATDDEGVGGRELRESEGTISRLPLLASKDLLHSPRREASLSG